MGGGGGGGMRVHVCVCVCVLGGGEGSWVIASTAVSSSGIDVRPYCSDDLTGFREPLSPP